MKRKPLFTILILTALMGPLGLFPSNLASAETISESDYWTLSEVVTVHEEIKTELIEHCKYSEEEMCEERYYFEEIMPREGIYWAADSIDAVRFLITAINPAKNTFRLFFSGEDAMEARMTGMHIEDKLDEVYLVWFDHNFRDYNFVDEYLSDNLPSKTHLLLAKNGLSDMHPSDEEVTYDADGDITASIGSLIYYYIITKEGARYLDPIDYTSCTNHPAYQAGSECRLVFDKSSGTPIYLPFKLESAADVDDTSIVELEPTASVELPLAPNTGVATSEIEPKTSELQWLIPLWIICGVPFLWLFWPKRKEN